MRKHVIIAISAILAASLGLSAQSRPTVYKTDMMINSLSDNGLYAVSTKAGAQDVDNPQAAGGTFIDLKTHNTTTIDAPSGWADVMDVADDGTVVGSSAGLPGYWKPDTRKWTTFNVDRAWGGGCFTAVTPDGTKAVGYYFDASNIFEAAPMYYDLTNGKPVAITNLPKVDMSGIDQRQNFFCGISPDGRYVLGQMSQSYLMPVALFSYVYDIETNTWKAIGFDFNETTKKFTPRVQGLHFIDTQFMSCDGKWVTGTAYMVFGGGQSEGGNEGYFPYRYNIETDSFEVYDALEDQDVAGNKITSDGTVLACTPAGNPYPTAVIRSGKYFISLDQILRQVYNVDKRTLIGDDVTGSFSAISADGLTAVMSTYDNCYVITMPEQFAEAAAKVDLLANYTPDIPDGSLLSKISEIQISFDRAIGCRNMPSAVKLIDGNGNEVRSASGFTVSQSNNHKLVITFRPYTLNPGEKYTIAIPEGYVWLKDDTAVKSKAINVSYVGRREGPVAMINATPADGATIAQINTMPDFVTVFFDTPIAIAANATATLYNDDDGSEVATLYGSADGNMAIFRPTASHVLYKGSDYRLEIPAGAVTDLSGAGASEAITLHYHGAYVRELMDDDIYIFNAPCNSYDNFIFWQNDFNVPAATPQSWGFAAENPWLLLRDNEQTDDWALAAHSMFTPAGESDDWLVTPQLYIPDNNAYLTFQAQSYLRSKDDVLKVYVYEDDAIYNYFSKELTEAFRADGDLVLDEVIPAGATDNGLDGEWQRYTIPLEKYAGKNIYIAFVNNNYDKSAIFLDNIQVLREMSFVLTNRTPVSVVDVTGIKVSGIVSIGNEILQYDGITLSLIDGEGNVVDRITDDVKLAFGDTYTFTFEKELPLTPGYSTDYSIEVSSGEESSNFRYNVRDLLFAPDHKVVIEEFTGAPCGNCPLGILALENLESLYPDNFIAVAVRAYTGDWYSTGITGYADFLGMSAAPSGRVNRGEILSPVLQNGAAGYTFYGRGIIESSGNEAHLWADEVQDLLETPAEAAVEASVMYDAATGQIDVPVNVTFALNEKGRSVSVFAVVVEDNLITAQLNYFSGISDPLLGEWGAGGLYGQATVPWYAKDAARFVVNGSAYNGTAMTVADFTAGESYPITLSGTIPAGRIADAANCRVVVMLIDGSSGRVINATQTSLTDAGISDVLGDADSTPAVYYNLQGQPVKDPAHGQIYIRVRGRIAEKIRF